MISQSTREMIADAFAVRELARVAVVGRKKPVTVYEPMFHEEYETRKNALSIFSRALSLFYDGNFIAALEHFSPIRDKDAAAAAYMEKCIALSKAPPREWEGVWIMTGK